MISTTMDFKCEMQHQKKKSKYIEKLLKGNVFVFRTFASLYIGNFVHVLSRLAHKIVSETHAKHNIIKACYNYLIFV